jgi:hypothetical protein
MAVPAGYNSWSKRRRQIHWQNKRNARNVLLDPSVPLSGGALEQAAKHLVDLEIGPQLAAVDRQIKNVQTQGGAVADRARNYFADIRGHEEGDRRRVDQINEDLQTRMSAIGKDAEGQIQGQANQIAARLAQDEQRRGPGLAADTAARVAAETTALTGRSALLGQAAQGEAAVIGGDMRSRAESSIRADRARGGEIQERLANQLTNTIFEGEKQRADIAGTRGEKTTANILKLRDSAVEQALTTAGLGIKQQDIEARLKIADQNNYTKRLISKMNRLEKQADRALRAKDNAAARRLRAEANQIRLDLGRESNALRGQSNAIAQQNADTNRRRADNQANSGGAMGKFTPQQIRSNRTKWDEALAAAGDVPGVKGRNLELILRGNNVDPLMAKWVAARRAKRKLSKADQKKFRDRYGFVPK